jgi:hypothetical protein
MRIRQVAPWIMIAWFPLFLAFVAADGKLIQAIYQTTPYVGWIDAGHLTTAHATLAVTGRNYATAVASMIEDVNRVVLEVPANANYAEIRYQVKANAETDVLECWYVKGERMSGSNSYDDLTLGFIHTLTGGQQTGQHTNVYADTIVSTDYGFATGVIANSGGDRICTYRVDLRGAKRLVWIATTVAASSTIYIQVTWY